MNLSNEEVELVVATYMKLPTIELKTLKSDEAFKLRVDGIMSSSVELASKALFAGMCRNVSSNNDANFVFIKDESIRLLLRERPDGVSTVNYKLFTDFVKSILEKNNVSNDTVVQKPSTLLPTNSDITCAESFNELATEFIKSKIAETRWNSLTGSTDLEKVENWLVGRKAKLNARKVKEKLTEKE